MTTRYVGWAVLGIMLPWTAAAQDARAILESAGKVMGSINVGSVYYTGSGTSYVLGQAANPRAPWPKFAVKIYTRILDFDAGASREDFVRTQGENPPRGGGPQPLIGEQKETVVIGAKQPWSTQFEMWITPPGFLKAAAAAGDVTAKAETVGAKKYNVVSFTEENKYKLNGYFNEQNQLEKVETWIENPVLGDMPVEADYTGYKDFGGFEFPTKIVEKQGGFPVADFDITAAKRNVIGGFAPPPAPGVPGRLVVDEALVAPGVYYFTGGTHHSVVVEFSDYVAVIEAPIDEARSAAVIGETKKLFANKPIRYVINTHQHFDHAAGLRAYAAEGATILTYQANKPYYETAWAAPRTLMPDKLSQSKKKVVIEGVAEKRVLTDGNRTLELYHVTNSGHDDGMLIAYLPKDKVVIEADLFVAPDAVPGASSGVSPAAAKQLAAATKPPPSPFTVSLVENLDRLKLDYDTVVALDSRKSTKEELLIAAGKTPNSAQSAQK